MASQENEKAMDGLLRRSLARDGVAKGECPSSEVLAAYYDQSLGATEAANYELHFSQCSRCREQLAMMARAGAESVADINSDLVPVAASSANRLVAAAPRGASAPAGSRAPLAAQTRRRILELRWLMPVAAVLVLSTLVFIRFASRGNRAEFGNQVAMSKSAPPQQDQVNSQSQTAAAESTTLDKSAENTTESDSPTSSGQPSSARSSASEDASGQSSANASRKRTEEAPSLRASAAPRHSDSSGSKSASVGHNAMPANGRNGVVRPPMVGAIVTPRFRSEPPPAPAPELNAALPSIAVATDAASPAPPPAPSAQSSAGSSRAKNGFGFAGRSSLGAVSRNAPASAKSTSGRTAALVIRTPDSNVLYRIVSGGFVERSQDSGVTWQGQLLDSSAEFDAGSSTSPSVCWVVGRAGVIFMTDDGKNWRNVSISGATDLASVDAKDEVSAIVTAADGQKWSTEDGGKTWTLSK